MIVIDHKEIVSMINHKTVCDWIKQGLHIYVVGRILKGKQKIKKVQSMPPTDFIDVGSIDTAFRIL